MNNDRRRFVRTAGAGLATFIGCRNSGTRNASDTATLRFDESFDVIVVGSGASGLASAATACSLGDKVCVVESAGMVGGTTLLSGGIFWIPNNDKMASAGIREDVHAILRYMARCSFPNKYRSNDPTLGLTQNEFALLDMYLKRSPEAIRHLERIGAIECAIVPPFKADYSSHFEEAKNAYGHPLIATVNGKITGAGGAALINKLQAFVESHGAIIKTGHRAKDLVQGKRGEVIGLSIETQEEPRRFFARKGVIFGSGGFVYNRQFVENFLAGPVFGSCGVPTNHGDFVGIASRAGAALGNMNHAWWHPVAIESTQTGENQLAKCFMPMGDSMILVDRNGDRVVNEYADYDSMCRTHFIWDSTRHEYRHKVLFLICDERTLAKWPGYAELGPNVLIRANSLEALAAELSRRVNKLTERIGPYSLSPELVPRLNKTIGRYNGFAKTGVDQDFHRGELPIERWWYLIFGGKVAQAPIPIAGENKPNITMHPIDNRGPFGAVIVGPGAMDTKGGPMTNIHAQILRWDGSVVPRLYGAGNCIASPTGDGYWGSGGTIGPALTLGFIAGQTVHNEVSYKLQS